MQGHQPTFVSVDAECIRRAIVICEIAIENTTECIAQFEQGNSHMRKEIFRLRELQKELKQSKFSLNELRKVLGWPGIVEDYDT